MGLWLVAAVMVGQLGATPASVEVVTLSNGMRWVLLARLDDRQVSGVVTVHAGGANESEGLTGAAHLLEHLAFAGTPVIGSRYGWRVEAPLQERAFELIDARAKLERQGENKSLAAMQIATELISAEREWRLRGDENAFTELMLSHDVRINAWTDKDTTTYWGDFPREQLHFWLAAEAQRFAAPVFREFRTERDVVLQERIDHRRALSIGTDALLAMAFEGNGYAWETTGREADLRTMSPRDLDRFYAEHYAPANAVGCLVGDFDPAEAKKWLEQTFAEIPNRPLAAPALVALTRPRTITRTAEEAWVLLGFETPPVFAPAGPAFEFAQRLLMMEDGPLQGLCDATGPCSALSVSAGPGLAEPHLTIVALRLRKGRAASEARAGFFRLLRGWAPSEELLGRARAALELTALQKVRTRKELAQALAVRQLVVGDWRPVFQSRHEATTILEVGSVLDGFIEEKAWVVEVESP